MVPRYTHVPVAREYILAAFDMMISRLRERHNALLSKPDVTELDISQITQVMRASGMPEEVLGDKESFPEDVAYDRDDRAAQTGHTEKRMHEVQFLRNFYSCEDVPPDEILIKTRDWLLAALAYEAFQIINGGGLDTATQEIKKPAEVWECLRAIEIYRRGLSIGFLLSYPSFFEPFDKTLWNEDSIIT